MNCPSCNTPLKPGAKFCAKCGTKIEQPKAADTCAKCGELLKPGAKFCAKCGAKVEQAPAPQAAENACVKCGAPLKPGAKFCAKCGASQEVPAPTQAKEPVVEDKSQMPADMAQATGRIFWNIMPGQLARVINETEFESYGDVKGIIVQPGVKAYIRANGTVVASIGGGTYDFVAPKKQTTQQAQEAVRTSWQWVTNLFSRRKPEANADSEAEKLYEEQQKAIFQHAQKGTAFSVVLMLDKAFPLLIGEKQKDIAAYAEFKPMAIATPHLNVGVGVNAYFSIVDHEKFMVHFLTERTVVNSAHLTDELAPIVKQVVQNVMGAEDITSNRLPKAMTDRIKAALQAEHLDAFFGVDVVRMVEVSAENADLDRFAALSRELYLSEQELDYLQRTNDFKNRLVDAQNNQRLAEARTDLELQRQLDELNKDNLLREDELLKFKQFLANERIVREATNDSERDAALEELARTGLIRQEETMALRQKLQTQTYQRVMAFEMMRLNDSIAYEKVRMQGEIDKAVTMVKSQLEIEALRDDYDDRRFYKDLEKDKAAANAALDVEQRQRDMNYEDKRRDAQLEMDKRNAQYRQFMEMYQAKEQAKQAERRDEAERERMRLEIEARREQAQLDKEAEIERLKWQNTQNLSAEQIWALQGDAEAAKAFAENKYSLDAERRANERVDRERAIKDQAERENKEMMMRMFEMAMNSNNDRQRERYEAQRTQDMLDDRNRQLSEREATIRRQEGRMDTAYDRALDYTTRNNVQAAANNAQPQPVQPQPQPVQAPVAEPAPKSASSTCPNCGAAYEIGTMFCEECGQKLL